MRCHMLRHVSLAVFDVTGREVCCSGGWGGSGGEQRVMWQAEGVGSGVYFVRLSAGEQMRTGKVLLIL